MLWNDDDGHGPRIARAVIIVAIYAAVGLLILAALAAQGRL